MVAIAQSGTTPKSRRTRNSLRHSQPRTPENAYPRISGALSGHRFYSPVIGRWLNRDPIGERGGRNLYGYCGNRAQDKIDPYGLTIWIQADGAPGDFVTKVIQGFQQVIGDCAKLRGRFSWKKKWISYFPPVRANVINYVEMLYSDEKEECKCDDCWQTLKAALKSHGGRNVIINYTADANDAVEEAGVVEINPDVSVAVPEIDAQGYVTTDTTPTPFPIVLWHEAIGHARLGLSHPEVDENILEGQDSSYYDPTIREENRARNCFRKLGNNIQDRAHQYYSIWHVIARPHWGRRR